MNTLLKILGLLIVVCLTCGSNGGGCDGGGGGGNTIYVDASYAGTGTGSQSQPFKTIAAGLNLAVSGDTVEVSPGLYRDNVRLKSGVTLLSKKTGAAIIHGGAERRGGNPTVTGADNAVIKGFSITGGYVGIKCDNTSPTIERNLIFANYGDGGVICLNNSRAIIRNNTILGNLGNSVNGISIGVYAEKATPTIMNNIITGNSIGYAPYKCTPAESYNNIWDNRRNYGYSASGGTGTISLDPLFQYYVNNTRNHYNDWDFRLSSTSPCRNAGNPAAQYYDADGSRNDMGAFDGNGGYIVSLPAQEYFIESVLSAKDDSSGPRINGLSRFTANPVFWFDGTGAGRQGETDVRALLTSGVPILSNNLYRATYHTGAQAPANPCAVVTISFNRRPQGIAYRRGVNAQCQDLSHTLVRNGTDIIGGQIYLPATWANGFPNASSNKDTLLHELGHVFGLFHSYRGDNIIGQGVGCCLGDYSTIEKEAFSLIYSHSSGTKLDALIRTGKIDRNALTPFPVIDAIQKITPPSTVWRDTVSARVGEDILLVGSRLSLRWSCDDRTSLRPPGYAPPDVYFGNIEVTADLSNQSSLQGSPVRFLKVTVPAGATSGWVWVKARGLESPPVYLEII